jgi:hypothetical protein
MSFDIFRFFCFTGLALILLGIIYSAIVYRGRLGERFSPLNHFISELGEVGVNPGARFFNLGLIVGGVLMLPYIVGLGVKLGSWLGWMGMVAGLAATQGVISVGLFPMNNLDPHIKAAQTYFRAGLVMVLLFGLAIVFQPAGRNFIPQWANLLSLLTFGVYAVFLLMLKPPPESRDPEKINSLDPAVRPARPRVWLFPIMEWLVFLFTLFWLFGMAFFI